MRRCYVIDGDAISQIETAAELAVHYGFAQCFDGKYSLVYALARVQQTPRDSSHRLKEVEYAQKVFNHSWLNNCARKKFGKIKFDKKKTTKRSNSSKCKSSGNKRGCGCLDKIDNFKKKSTFGRQLRKKRKEEKPERKLDKCRKKQLPRRNYVK